MIAGVYDDPLKDFVVGDLVRFRVRLGVSFICRIAVIDPQMEIMTIEPVGRFQSIRVTSDDVRTGRITRHFPGRPDE